MDVLKNLQVSQVSLQSGAFQGREGRPVAAVDPQTAVKVRWSRVALPLTP